MNYEGYGIETALRGFLDGLAYVRTQHEFVLYTPSQLPTRYTDSYRERMTVKTVGPNAVNLVNRFVWDHLRIPQVVKRDLLDALFVPVHVGPLLQTVPTLVYVPDMMYHLFPHWWSFSEQMYVRLFEPLTTKRAAGILTNSESTKSDIVRRLGVSPDKIHVILPGVPSGFGPDSLANDQRVLEHYAIRTPFILGIAPTHVRKNTGTLVESFKLVDSNVSHTLVLFGRWSPEFRELRRQAGQDSRIVILDEIPRQDIPALMRLADAFVFPSLYEGFGFPIIEAMACGCPVITSNNSSMVEIASTHGLCVDPLSPPQLATAIQSMITDRDLNDFYRAQSLKRAQDYRWDKAAGAIVDVLISLTYQ